LDSGWILLSEKKKAHPFACGEEYGISSKYKQLRDKISSEKTIFNDILNNLENYLLLPVCALRTTCLPV
jgi:hypothetical protein